MTTTPHALSAPTFLLWAGLLVGVSTSTFLRGEEEPASATDPAPAAPTNEPGPEIFGRFIAQPQLGSSEAQEMFEVVATRAAAELGYRSADPSTAAAVPPVPDGVHILGVLVRRNGESVHLIQLGYRLYNTQPLHLWIYGQVQKSESPPVPNEDIDRMEQFLAEARKSHDEKLGKITAADLAHKKIELSYIEPDRCLTMLRTLGLNVINPGDPVDINKLPTIVALPHTKNHTLLEGVETSFPLTGTDPINELLVFYHPARPEQYSQILDKVRNLIDLPARQIVIEVMVLEISEVGITQLGLEWELESPGRNFGSLKVGRLPPAPPSDFAVDLQPTVDAGLRNIFGEFAVTIQSLIVEGEAEVLSRPSVTTLDNRMAHINVERRIPVVTSVNNPNANSVTVNFKEVRAGITLNVRPRVTADESEVSMQVAASVTARVPNEDVEVFNSNGDQIARAPTISARLVKTQTRVPNNTPFIIGGLVSNDAIESRDKVPVLGDIPLVGPLLFSQTSSFNRKREVIIVVTPRLLPENEIVNAAIPEDKDAFDSFDNRLFRDAYRIRAEDVFDLGFLIGNRQLRQMQHLADLIAGQNVDLGETYPFNQFVGGRIPGERILIYRQMYEVIKRKNLNENIAPTEIIFFQQDEDVKLNFDVRFLWHDLAQRLRLRSTKEQPARNPDLFSALRGKALAMTYTLRSDDVDPSDILGQPVPEVRILDCPDSATWSRLLWDYNQQDRDGRQRYTVLIHNEKDLTRLCRAIILRRTVQINAARQALTLPNFHIGRMLLMPTIKEEKVYLIDEDVAKYFFYTEQYYPVVKMELTRDLEAMHAVMQLPSVQQYLHDHETP